MHLFWLCLISVEIRSSETHRASGGALSDFISLSLPVEASQMEVLVYITSSLHADLKGLGRGSEKGNIAW